MKPARDTVSLRQAARPFALALDLGSSSVRAMLYDARARLIQIEIGRVPVFTYADTRANADAAALRRALGPRRDSAAYQRTGCPRHAAYAPPRRLWLRRTNPRLFARIDFWCDLPTYVYRRWFEAEAPTSYSIAAWNGLLDSRRLAWDAQGGGDRAMGLPPWKLPPIADYDAAQRGLARPFRDRWPALAEIPFCLAVGDGAAANIGCGGTGPHTAVLSVGTTAAIRVVALGEPPDVPPGLWRYRVDRERNLLGGATTEGGNVFRWLIETLRLNGDEADERLAAMAPDSHGLTFLPFFAGERSPGLASDARAAITGLSLATTPDQIARAGLEAVALRFALIADLLGKTFTTAKRIVADGGAIRASAAWRRIFADALGRPLSLAPTGEATSRGVALLALRAAGLIPSLDALPLGELPSVKPSKERTRLYRDALLRQRDLYKDLIARGGRVAFHRHESSCS
ncbi:MAG: FGGY-family carbohydrate kinase [Candidatus Sumerlaeota bacterium]|nr:FGGY-family carbohydrate kinase [Candidatus Sumerlaeota bacterium]